MLNALFIFDLSIKTSIWRFPKTGVLHPKSSEISPFFFEIHGLAPFEETPISFGDSRVFPTEFAGLEPLSGSLVLGSFISQRQARPFSPNVGPQNSPAAKARTSRKTWRSSTITSSKQPAGLVKIGVDRKFFFAHFECLGEVGRKRNSA